MLIKTVLGLGMVAHSSNPSKVEATWEVEAGGVRDQPELHSKILPHKKP